VHVLDAEAPKSAVHSLAFRLRDSFCCTWSRFTVLTHPANGMVTWHIIKIS
jgi:hypothetical protein